MRGPVNCRQKTQTYGGQRQFTGIAQRGEANSQLAAF